MNKIDYLWSAADVALMQKLHAQGVSHSEIGSRINRTGKAVRVKLKRLSFTDEQRLAYNRKEKARGKKYYQKSLPRDGSRGYVAPDTRAPEDVLADREARRAAPQDITGAFFGDPPKGFSALERRA